MMRTSLVAALLLVVAACGGSDDELTGAEEEVVEQMIEEASDQDVDVEIDSEDDGGFTMTIDEEDGTGQVSLGGGLPEDFPFPLPAEYEVGTSMELEQDGGVFYSAVIHADPDEFGDLATMYETWLEDEGFEVNKSEISSGETSAIFLMGQRDDVAADISMSLDDVANDDAGNVIYQTNISLTWTSK